MPLEKSSSKEALSRNIKEMKAAGRPQDQAVAASLDNQRQAKAKGYNKGGSVEPSTEPVAAANLLDTVANPTSRPEWSALKKGGKAGWRRGL